MVNVHEKIHFIISISDERLSSFFISFISFLLFFFPYLFRFNFVLSEGNVHSFFPTYLGGAFSPLLDISEWNIFYKLGVGGGGARALSALPYVRA